MNCDFPCFLDSLAYKSLIIDKNLNIKLVNQKWIDCINERDLKINNYGPGSNYIDVLIKINDLNHHYYFEIKEEIKKVISNKKDKFEFEYPDYCLETTNWFKLVATPFDQGALILHENITDRKKTQEDLKLKEKQYRTVFNQAPIGIILEDPNGKILEVNKTLTEMTGYSKQELEGKNIFDHLVAKERVGEAKEDIKIILNGQDLEFNLDNIDKKGNHYYTHFKETRIELPNHGTGILSMQVDLTNLRKKQRQLEYLSYHDELTGLYNRAFFNEEINRLDTKREIPLSIIVADVNGLKLVNDTYGHSIGDKLIIETAKLLKSNLRSEDILARFGGDEFAIILSQTSEKEAEKIVERIKKNSKKIKIEDFRLSLGIGLATKETMEIPVYKIFNAADTNMYKDKLTKGRSAKNNLVKNIINTLGVKSNETKEHAIRVEELVLKLGENLSLSYKDMNNLSLLATLHDIGKVTIDETILKKPGRLTESEWKIMKKHTERGYNIANSTDEFSIIAKYILHHHERWDGNGYPERLKQEEIPLLSRIISLVDSFDVMTHDRPYSKAMSVKLALKEVRNCSGSQFDPYLVKEFMKLF